MIEHPVPQNITEYQFHLIGNMTIKQFLILLAGVVLSVMVYTTNLPAIIQWPLIIISVGGAAIMAFVPYEERTLDQWFVNFLRAIYRPTKFYWRRTAQTPLYFDYTPDKSKVQAMEKPDLSPYRKQQVSEFLSSLQTRQKTVVADPLDLFQDNSQSLGEMFDSVAAAEDVTPGKELAIEKPDLQVRARPLGAQTGVIFSSNTTESAVPEMPVTQEPATSPAPQYAASSADTSFTSFSVDSIQPAAGSTPVQSDAPTTASDGQARVDSTVAAPVSVAATPAESTPQPTRSTGKNKGADNLPQPTAPSNYMTVGSTTQSQSNKAELPAVFNPELPFPTLPDKPNMLIGMVHGPDGSIVPNAIVEILDTNGSTVRAMKTNTLGQFFISTPLKSGTYKIDTEANGFQFPVYTFEANNEVLPPVDIQAHG